MRLATVQFSTYKEWQKMELLRHTASFLLRNIKASDAAIQKITVLNSVYASRQQITFAMCVFRYAILSIPCVLTLSKTKG